MRRPSTRRYDATKRQEKAAGARERILAAASKLFSRHGIDVVTIEQVAASAKVSAASVYAQFRSKGGLLEALAHAVLLGPTYQESARQVDSLDDPAEALLRTASIARGVYEREQNEIPLIRGAAAYSPALKKLVTGLEKTRRELQMERAKLVYRSNPELKRLGLEKVRDILCMFTSHDVYRMLVLESGWSRDEYERWMGDSLVRTLLHKRDVEHSTRPKARKERSSK